MAIEHSAGKQVDAFYEIDARGAVQRSNGPNGAQQSPQPPPQFFVEHSAMIGTARRLLIPEYLKRLSHFNTSNISLISSASVSSFLAFRNTRLGAPNSSMPCSYDAMPIRPSTKTN